MPRFNPFLRVNARIGIVFLLAAAWGAFGLPRFSLAILAVNFPDLVPADREEFIRDLGRTLATDSVFLVYDARAQHAAALDKALENTLSLDDDLRRRVYAGEIRFGLVAGCQVEEEYREEPVLSCQFSALDLKEGGIFSRDSAAFEAGIQSHASIFKPILAEKFRGLLRGKSSPVKSKGPSLHLAAALQPARLERGSELLARGKVSEIPLGFTLVTGDMSGYGVASLEEYSLVLFPHSSYTYLVPGVICLNEGTLGVIRTPDTVSVLARLESVTHLDQSNALWKTVSQLAALDSTNLIWKSLGKIVSADSQMAGSFRLRQVLAMDSTSPLFRTLAKLVALDSGKLVLKTLAEVSSLDSSNLIWKGIGKASSLDSAEGLWRKIGAIAAQDSSSLWRKVGLLSMHGETMVLTPSCVLRGKPVTAQIEFHGDLARLELVKGEMLALPVLSSQQPQVLRDLEWGETHGFALERGRLGWRRADHIGSDLQSAFPRSSGYAFTELLPVGFFAHGRAVPVFPQGVQENFLESFREFGSGGEVLSAKPSLPDADGNRETGTHASGCYLCRPDHLGP